MLNSYQNRMSTCRITRTFTEHGRIPIPGTEADAILENAGIYDGLTANRAETKEAVKAVALCLPSVWQAFLHARRQSTRPRISRGTLFRHRNQPRLFLLG